MIYETRNDKQVKERAKPKVHKVMLVPTLPYDSNNWIKKNKNAEIEVAEVKILTS
jgi:hypothetical protein